MVADFRPLLVFLVLFILIDGAMLAYVIYKHERVHAHVAEYFGYSPGDVVFRGGAISQSVGVPVSELNTPKYWAYLAAQSSVDAVGYHLLMLVPFLSATFAGVFTWLIERILTR